VHRAELPEDVPSAHGQASPLSPVLEILRVEPEASVRVDAVAGAEGQGPAQLRTCVDAAALADGDLRTDDGVGADLDVVGQLGRRVDDGGAVNGAAQSLLVSGRPWPTR
jgi:hypothetical protein